ncbi:doublesex- and mab-3-related transcription factor B1 [Mesoplodon densirostris]|uniref:doublesex- and mab-3-related transcription factor B1 n=1 Tax=Mesoplodon densirostris TaxID=48708 RepID=UPI0028DBF2C8|nr:doublesex- and mab-3-related transcription factor B1 [Mesoplodon densirostris]
MKADLAKLADKMLRTPRCSRCRNHGFLVPVKGHAGKCRWKQCTCKKCYLITKRHKIMAKQQVHKKQVSEEEQEVALCAQGPQLASGAAAAVPGSSFRPLPPPAASGDAQPGPEGRTAACFLERPPRGPSPGLSAFQPVLGGRGHVGPSKRAAAAMPSSLRPQLGAEAAGRGCPGRLELSRPLLPVLSPPFADFGPPLNVNSDRVVGSEYLEREASKLYCSCSSVHPYHPFLLGYQDASLTLGAPLQRGLWHVSYSHYSGAGLLPWLLLRTLSPRKPAIVPTLYQALGTVIWQVLAEQPVPGALCPGVWATEVNLPHGEPPIQENERWVEEPVEVQSCYSLLPRPPQFPPRYLSMLHFLPLPLPSSSLSIMSAADEENTDDQDAEGPCEPSQPSSQEQSD